MSLTDLVLSTSLKLSPAATVAPSVGCLHVDHVAERLLGVIGDSDPGAGAVDGDPLVITGVEQVGRNRHGPAD